MSTRDLMDKAMEALQTNQPNLAKLYIVKALNTMGATA